MDFIGKNMAVLQGNEPIEYAGLKFYPLLVRDFPLYNAAKPVFELMQASLSPALARLSWCECLREMDNQGNRSGKTIGFLDRALLVLARTLRLPEMGGTYPIRCAYDKGGNLTAIVVAGSVTGAAALNMRQMTDVRKIIAELNKYDLPNESWNPELVRAAQIAQSGKTVAVDVDFETLLFSVAKNWGCRVSELLDWPVREFLMAQEAIDRTFNFQIYTLAEAVGFCKFPHGNPFPSWKYNKAEFLPSGFITEGELDVAAKGLLKNLTPEKER